MVSSMFGLEDGCARFTAPASPHHRVLFNLGGDGFTVGLVRIHNVESYQIVSS